MRTRFAVFLIALFASGCRQSTPPPPASPFAVRSLQDMEAEHWRLHQQYAADCIDATPEKVAANRPLCEQELQHMAPLGNEIMRREQEATKPAP